jgi:hypothetical protein
MAINRKTWVFWLSVLVVHFFTNHSVAQEGGPQIGRALQDFDAMMRAGSAERMPSTVRDCYLRLQVNMGVDKVAYCFALDYVASKLTQTFPEKYDAESKLFLSIEKALTRVNRALSARKIEQAERGPLIAYWANSSRAILAQLAAPKQSNPMPSSASIERAKIAVLKLVSDPSHARLSDLKVLTTPNVRGEPTEVVCGRISERSGTGIYTASRPFVYFVNDQTANYDNGAEDMDREIVKNFCVH